MAARADAWIERLDGLAHDEGQARVLVGDILAAAGDGGVAVAILFFALLNALPSLPGTSSVLGAPLLLLTAQQLQGRSAWVPGWMARLSISRVHLQALVARLHTLLAWRTNASRSRLDALVVPLATQCAGGLGCVLAVLLVLPLPLVNIPIGMTLSLLSFGRLRGDGLVVLLGLAAGIASLGLAGGVLWGAGMLL